jgi:hypothetical protein
MPSGQLEVWTVYANPRDCPGKIVIRKSLSSGPTNEAYVFDDLDAARAVLLRSGLTCLPRFPEDDPVIVEVWL